MVFWFDSICSFQDWSDYMFGRVVYAGGREELRQKKKRYGVVKFNNVDAFWFLVNNVKKRMVSLVLSR